MLYPFQRAYASSQIPAHPLLLVIDALDECSVIHAKAILNLFARNIQFMQNVKVFITTRPESHIQVHNLAPGLLQPFYLHEIDKSVAREDIQLFLEHALSKKQIQIVLKYSQWEPTKDELKALVEKCGILFIMATTAVRYILDEANQPASQMRLLLSGLDIKEKDEGVMSSLDKMYAGILKSAIPKRYRTEYLEKFQRVIGAVVVLEDPLPVPALAKFLGLEILEVHTTLQNLHSIMAPTSNNQAPQLYHQSFPDFITNSSRCTDERFYIIPDKQHATSAKHCFQIMAQRLHENMYNLQGIQKYMTNAEIEEVIGGNNITEELRYACIHWATHLSKAGDDQIDELHSHLQEFAFKHLLHWIEVLSFVGKLDVVHSAIALTQQVLVSD